MDGALRPSSIDDIRGIWQKREEEEAEKIGIDLEDQAFATLSMSRGWKFLKKHIDSLKIGLDKRLSESVLKSLGDSQIKTDALFAVLGKDLLDSIISKVEDTALVVEELKDGKRRK